MCPVCGKSGAAGPMKHFHFDNCGKTVHLSEENMQKLSDFFKGRKRGPMSEETKQKNAYDFSS